MANFIDFEVSVEEDTKEEEDEVCDSDLDSLNSFIDDDNVDIENNRTFYQKFENVTNSVDNVLKEEYDKSIGEIDKLRYLIFVKHLKRKQKEMILRIFKKE